MRPYLSVLLGVLSVLAVHASASDLTHQNATRGDAGLVGWWKLDDIGCRDSSGHGNHGTAAGNPSFVSGKIGKAFSGNGTDQYVDIGKNVASLGITRWATFAGWGRATSFTSNPSMFSDWDSIGTTLRIDAAATSATFYVYPNNHRIVGSFSFATNTWYHLCGVMDGANMYLYVNGTQVGTQTLGEDIGSSASTLKLARFGNSSWYGWPGMLDDLRIYNRALSNNEVRQLYADTNLAYRFPRRDSLLAFLLWRLP